MVWCIKVKKEDAESVRLQLISEGLLDSMYAPKKDGKYVYFPILKKKEGYDIVEVELEHNKKRAKSLLDELKVELSPAEVNKLIRSFDIIGDIAVIDVPNSLSGREHIIASALQKIHHNVKVVAKKIGATQGEYRIRPVEVIAGPNRTTTVHKESGCKFELDINKVYFSPRLSTERDRIAKLVKNDETVLVPFAGVGPFAIRIAKIVPSSKVVGIEINTDAIEYFKKNIKINKVSNVSVICGDVKEILPGAYVDWASRIVMPLPKDGTGFLPNIIPCLKKNGMLHYYSFEDSSQPYKEAELKILSAAEKLGRQAKIKFQRIVRPFSKNIVQVVTDAEIG
ncbi:MAG: class I SAM-dependent methyltransferase family protein [Candidatus Anstonellaceae archaeon]